MKLHPIFSDYVISEEGNVYNFHTQKKLKPQNHTKGYVFFILYQDKKRHTKSIHRLLMETYNPIENDNLYQVHHQNEIKDDNRLENLKWELIEDHTREHHKGKVVSEETRKKIGGTLKGHLVSEETRRKIGEGNKGLKWWNNGVKTIRTKTHPGEGWVRGRL